MSSNGETSTANVARLFGAAAPVLIAAAAVAALWVSLLRLGASSVGAVAAVAALALAVAAIVRGRRDAPPDERSARLQVDGDLRMREARYRTIFEAAELGFAVVDAAGNLVESNIAFERILLPAEQQKILSEVRETAAAGEPEQAGEDNCERRHRRFFRTGSDVVWIDLAIARIANVDGTVSALCMVQDITARKKSEEQLGFEATHDALTGLANRPSFEAQLRIAFEDETERAPFALFFLDLDKFKYVNDTFGHQAGDTVIKLVGKRLRASVSSNDLVARFGGDEFAVLVRGVERSDVAVGIAERIHNNVTVPFKVEGRPVAINASLGLVLSSTRYSRPEDLLRDADTAMFAAKSNRSGFVLFDAAHQIVDGERLELQSDLLTALQRKEFYVVYQPIARLDDGAAIGYEALLRWAHPKQGTIMPGVFVPLLELVGLIQTIGQWMVRQACLEFAALRERHPDRPDLFLHLNVSVHELFAREFERNLLLATSSNHIASENVVVEITESGMLENGERTDNILGRLRTHGFRLCIDDFGTGYSSLEYLQRLDLDSIKIDRSFVSGEGGGIASEPIVKTLVTLADSFGVGIVAEGVETQEQRDFLLAIGCKIAQGYLFGRPERLADLTEPRTRGR